MVNESSLITFLESDEIIKCVDLYDWGKQIYIFLDYMNGSSIDKVIHEQHQSYSEEFCKYSLYKAAMGLMKMHG